MPRPKPFIAYEHLTYNLKGTGSGKKQLPEDLFEGLKRFHGENGTPYYSLTSSGVKFNEFVGVIQIGNQSIEVLPKIDKANDEGVAQRVLIEMLRSAGYMKIHAPTSSSLKLRSNYILEAYINMFLEECQQLFHLGLIKTYRKTEGNRAALKGRLMFAQQIQKNLVHAERFYVQYTTYDRQHPLNKVLYKTLRLISGLTSNAGSIGRVNRLLLDFPELPDIPVSENFFERINWNRKSEPYRKAMQISALLLLNYHPDLSSGRNNVLALMFDMNVLWEKYVLNLLKRSCPDDTTIRGQKSKYFWRSNDDNGGRLLKPDIVVEFLHKTVIIDTKWKLVDRSGASAADLRQMLAYNLYFGKAEQEEGSEKSSNRESYLLYPMLENEKNTLDVQKGRFTQDMGHTHLMWMPFVKNGQLNSEVGKSLIDELQKGITD